MKTISYLTLLHADAITAGMARALAFMFIMFLSTALAQEPKPQEPEVEIKLFVPEQDIDKTLDHIKKNLVKESTKHCIYFFDTDDKKFYNYQNGPAILRARQKRGKQPQATVKFRRTQRDPVLEKNLGAKIEIQTEATVGKEDAGISYTLDSEIDPRVFWEIRGAGDNRIAPCFSPKQKECLQIAGVLVDWKALKVWGGIEAEVWQWAGKDALAGVEITAELWRLGDSQILEVSCKLPAGDLAKQVSDFTAFCEKEGIVAAKNPESKTKQALEYFTKNGLAAAPKPDSATPENGWHKVGDGKQRGIGGIAFLDRQDDELSFLVVHDNKEPWEDRVGILRRTGSGVPTYQRLYWPGKAPALPIDLEALTAIPGVRDDFLTTTSKGKVYRIRVDVKGQAVEVLTDFEIAGEKNEVEAFAIEIIGTKMVAVWADRGDGEESAKLSWSDFDLTAATDKFTNVQTSLVRVPWPKEGPRDITDVRVDGSGAILVSSAFDNDPRPNEKPKFASAVYIAGVLAPEAGKILFHENKSLTRLLQTEGRKIEAIELVPGKDGGIILGTDDEFQGSSLFFSW